MTNAEKWSIGSTVAFAVIAAIGAIYSMQTQSVLGLAVSVGALGGLAHEIAQSGGKVMFFQRHSDGLYLGSLAGMVLGAVAGVLVVRGHLTDAPRTDMVQLAYEIFMAGLALKGVTEAAGGAPAGAADVPAGQPGNPADLNQIQR